MSMTFDDNEDKDFLRLLELMEEGFKLFTVAMPVNFVPLFRYIPGVNYAYQKIKGNRAETSDFFRKIADQHRASLDPDNIRDIVDAYLVRQAAASEEEHKESYFSEAQLIQIMNDLFSAGLETVTSTIEWAVLFLMKHRRVQARLYAEVQSVIGDERSPELDDLANMPYTEATIYEVLRRSNVIALGNAHAALQ
jgi:26-hydroxylase